MSQPLSDADYERREVERIALEEAQETRGEDFWDEMEGSVELPEFLSIPTDDEERVERDWDRMLAQEDLALYSEWGVVR
jgi:hypothetical protein